MWGVALGFWGLDLKVCDFCILDGSFEALESPEEKPGLGQRMVFQTLSSLCTVGVEAGTVIPDYSSIPFPSR